MVGDLVNYRDSPVRVRSNKAASVKYFRPLRLELDLPVASASLCASLKRKLLQQRLLLAPVQSVTKRAVHCVEDGTRFSSTITRHSTCKIDFED